MHADITCSRQSAGPAGDGATRSGATAEGAQQRRAKTEEDGKYRLN